MKKLIAIVSTLFIAIALSLVAVAAPASAHTATLTGSVACNTADGSATVTWTVINDYNELLNITASNNAAIPVNTTIAATGGGPNTSKTFTQTLPAPAAGHTATATLSFLWSGDNFTQTNTTFTTNKVSKDCTVPIPKDASAAVVVTPAACAAAETAVEGTIANATWDTSTVVGGVFKATATATPGHQFASAGANGTLSMGNTVDKFSVTLAPALSATSDSCRKATAAVVTTAATCQGPETVAVGAITFATWGTITYPTAGSYSVTATATSGYTFSNGHTTLTLTGTLAAQTTGHPCEDFIIVAWHMPSWDNSTTPTWPQQIFTSQEEGTPDLSALDSQLTEVCGVQYQVDIYYNSPITASLINGGYLDGPNNPPEDLIPGGWGVAYKLVQGPACATPVTPTESDTCANGGSITITAVPGVLYFVNGNAVDTSGGNVVVPEADGPYVVTAVPAAGYLLTGYPSGGWSFNINTDCTASYASSGDCTAANGVSQEDVTLNLVNPSGTAATFVVTSSDSTVTPTGSYNVDAHSTLVVDVGSTTDSGGTFDVSINGGTAIPVNVNSFVGCIPATPADPTFTVLSCTGSTTNFGSISTDGNPDFTYTLTGNLTGGGTVGPENFASLPGTPSFTGLAAGDYTVTVVANPGFVLSGGGDFPVDIPLAAVNCIGTQQDPVVSFVNPTCEPNEPNPPVNQDTSSELLAALTEVEGTITIPPISDTIMTFTIDGTPSVPGTYVEPDGPHVVVATLTSTAVADGYTFATDPGYTISDGGTVATFATITFTSDCGLPTLASWHSGATGTPATCTLSGSDIGTITLVHGSDAADPTDENGKVTYTLVNLTTSQTTDLGSTALSVNVAPGSYKVEAIPTDPADGLVGNPNITNEIDYFVTIAAAAGGCGDLALTGGTIGWFGFALAGGMLFLGIAFLYMKRRGNRTAE